LEDVELLALQLWCDIQGRKNLNLLPFREGAAVVHSTIFCKCVSATPVFSSNVQEQIGADVQAFLDEHFPIGSMIVVSRRGARSAYGIGANHERE
jgi:hypothetical protein